MTDFSGASLAEVLRHVVIWEAETRESIARLCSTIEDLDLVTDEQDRRALRSYAEFFVEVLQVLQAGGTSPCNAVPVERRTVVVHCDERSQRAGPAAVDGDSLSRPGSDGGSQST